MPNLSVILNPDYYYLNPFSIGPFLTAGLGLVLGAFVYRLDNVYPFHRSFMYFCFNAFFWLVADAFILNSLEIQVAQFWTYIFCFMMLFMPAVTYHFSAAITENIIKKSPLIVFLYCCALFLIGLMFLPFFLPVIRWGDISLFPQGGLWILMVATYMTISFYLTFSNFIEYHSIQADPEQKKQIRYFLMWFLVLIFAFFDVFPKYNLIVYPTSFIVFFGFILSITLFQLRTFYGLKPEKNKAGIPSERNIWKPYRLSKELRSAQLKLLEQGKTSALVRLSGGILHQLSQPLTTIHGLAQFLIKEMDQEDSHYKSIRLIEEQSANLKQMLKDLSDLITRRKMKKEPVDINAVIKRLLVILSDELRMCLIESVFEPDEGAPFVSADWVYLQQAFLNIITNAIQAMDRKPKGEKRKLTITTSYHPAEQTIRVSFQDLGSGIGSEDIPKVFEPLYSTKPKSIGLGMTIALDLIKEQGGNISIESEDGKGTTVTVALPVTQISGRKP